MDNENKELDQEVLETTDGVESADNAEAKIDTDKWHIHEPSKWLMNRGDIIYYSVMLFLMLAIIITSKFLVGIYTVEGDSMRNTLTDGDLGICKKCNIKNSMKPNDIVIFWSDDLDEYIIKRCVAVHGDTIEMHEGILRVNGKVIDEPYIREPMEEGEGEISYMELGDNEFFAMGDNRNESCDCRDLGPGTYDKVNGIVLHNFGQTKITKKHIIVIIVIIFAIFLALSFVEDAILRKRVNKLPEGIRNLDFDYEENEDGTFTVGLRSHETGELHETTTVSSRREANAYAKQFGKRFYHYLPKK